MGTMANQPAPKPKTYADYHNKRQTKNGPTPEPSGGSNKGH